MTEPKRSQKKNKQDFCSASISHQPLSLLTSAFKQIKQTTNAPGKYIVKPGYIRFTAKR